MNTFLGFDVGATKTAWATISEEGVLEKSGRFLTPKEPTAFISVLSKLISEQAPTAVGIGIAGTITADRTQTIICPNIPTLSDLAVVELLQETHKLPIVLDNDARCALIGEVWKGSLPEMTSAVLVTIGTGIGGSLMQKGVVQPHPQDIGEEIGRIIVDPTDVFPAASGHGTIEAFLGGRNLEERLQIDLEKMAKKVRSGDNEAIEVWHAVSYYFIQCMRAIHNEFSCKNIIIGGVGVNDLQYYLQDPAPCTILAATLGEQAALYGAARLAIDTSEEEADTDWE